MRQKVADYIADFIAEWGIRQVFTVTGGGAMHMNDAFGHHSRLHCTYQHLEQACAMAAEAYARLDNEMAEIREEIQEAQMTFQLKANVVAQILNNINQLFRVADKQMVMDLQNEFFQIYNHSNMEELRQFNKRLDRVAANYMAQSGLDSDIR